LDEVTNSKRERARADASSPAKRMEEEDRKEAEEEKRTTHYSNVEEKKITEKSGVEEESSLTSKIKESASRTSKIVSDTFEGMTLVEEEEEEEMDEEVEKEMLLQREIDSEEYVLRRGKDRLEKMISRLETEIEAADVEIGSSLNVLDQNHDGMCTTQELRNAFEQVLKDDEKMTKADELIRIVDPSEKGYFNIADLHDILAGLDKDDPDMQIFEYLGGGGSDKD
jgi:hypothetical protein